MQKDHTHVEFEKVIESQYITRRLSNRADELTEQAKELSLRNVRISKLVTQYSSSYEEERNITIYYMYIHL